MVGNQAMEMVGKRLGGLVTPCVNQHGTSMKITRLVD